MRTSILVLFSLSCLLIAGSAQEEDPALDDKVKALTDLLLPGLAAAAVGASGKYFIRNMASPLPYLSYLHPILTEERGIILVICLIIFRPMS